MTISASLKDQIETLYVGYFGRASDSAGASYWMSQIKSGAMTLDKVAASFAVQPEAQGKYAYLSAPTATSPTDFINQVYHQLFNHDADTAGLQYWSQQLAAAQGSAQAIGQFILNVISGATGGDDATLRNKGNATVVPPNPDATRGTGTTGSPSIATWPSTEAAPSNDKVAAATLFKMTTSTATSASDGGSYFFTMYDVTNSRLGINSNHDLMNTASSIEDTAALIASVNMSAADYAFINHYHFSLLALV